MIQSRIILLFSSSRPLSVRQIFQETVGFCLIINVFEVNIISKCCVSVFSSEKVERFYVQGFLIFTLLQSQTGE